MIYLCYLGIWSYISLSAHQFGRDDYHNRSYRIGLLIDVMQWRLTCLAVLQAVGFAWTVYYMGTELLELYRLTLKDERCECCWLLSVVHVAWFGQLEACAGAGDQRGFEAGARRLAGLQVCFRVRPVVKLSRHPTADTTRRS